MTIALLRDACTFRAERRSPMESKPKAEVGRRPEPTNEQLTNGTWQQLPQTVTVEVPEGVYAKLAQARELYEELTDKEHQAYVRTSSSQATGKSFAVRGDMSPETATVLAVASASKIFDRIEAYIPRLQDRRETPLIGSIDTIDGTRYFRLDKSSGGRGRTKDIVRAARPLAVKAWLGKHRRIVSLFLAIVMLVGPVVLIFLTDDGIWLLWWLLPMIVAPLLGK